MIVAQGLGRGIRLIIGDLVLVVMVFAGFLGFFIFYGRMGAFLLGIVTLSVSLMLGAFLNQTGDASYHIGKVQLGSSLNVGRSFFRSL